ncbi:MAG TPA: hypothetical protein VMG08_13800 [Allosphingosinicella sp.]|nr:hypothetical protein [Allosphingosinicella sp.]
MVRDRWDDEDDLDRDRGGRLSEPTLGEVIDGAVRKVVTSVVIAGGLIALGIYGAGSGGGGGSDLEYQIVTSADGQMVHRINTDSGSIVSCRVADNRCWLMQRASRDLDDEPPKQNAAAPVQAAPQQQAPAQVAPAQPAPQLPAPTNTAVPATR